MAGRRIHRRLSSQSIVRIEFDGTARAKPSASPWACAFALVEQGPDGAIWILEDGREGRGGQGRMFRLTARSASGQ